MNGAVIIFGSSFVGIVIMLCVKLYHLKADKDLFFHDFFRTIDHKIINGIIWSYKHFLVWRHSVKVNVLHFLNYVLSEYIIKWADAVVAEYNKISSSIKGKRIMKSRGSASFFLKNVSEYKSQTIHK